MPAEAARIATWESGYPSYRDVFGRLDEYCSEMEMILQSRAD